MKINCMHCGKQFKEEPTLCPVCFPSNNKEMLESKAIVGKLVSANTWLIVHYIPATTCILSVFKAYTALYQASRCMRPGIHFTRIYRIVENDSVKFATPSFTVEPTVILQSRMSSSHETLTRQENTACFPCRMKKL